MHFNDVDFKDGKIVALGTETWFKDVGEYDDNWEEESLQ